MMPQWYFARNREKYGPYSMGELQQFAASGRLLPTDMLLQEGAQKWVTASSLSGLFVTAAITAQPASLPIPRPEVMPYSPAQWEIQEVLPVDLQDPHQPTRPSLWNPNAAVNWSLLFTPIFGAYLHAANWRVLGKPGRATANMAWVWATVAFLVINVGALFLIDSKAIDGLIKGAGVGLLLGWYFTQGMSQAKYLKNAFPDGYLKKSWGAPLGIGIGGGASYFAIVFLVAIAAYSPDPNDLAAEVKPLILQDWQKKPQLKGATIRNVLLVHKGGKVYTGFVEATIDGRSEKLALEVVHDRGTILWELKLLDTGQNFGTLLTFSQGELYYTPLVTRADAQKLGEYLVKQQYFNGKRKTVQLNRSGDTYEVRLVTKKGSEQDQQIIDVMKQFALEISRDVFGSAAVDIHMCDDRLETVRVVVPLQ